MGCCCITQGAQPGALRQPRGVGWGREWEEGSRGRETCIYLWLIHADVWQKLIQHCKAIILQFKKKILKHVLISHTVQFCQVMELIKGKSVFCVNCI